MNGKIANTGDARRSISPEDGEAAVKTIARMVNVSILASFLRDFPLTYLTAEERRVFLSFQQFAVHMENEAFEEAGIA